MPILYNKHLYIHMPKTGGIWVEKVLSSMEGGFRIPKLNRHTAASAISEALRDGHVLFGTIRDPWSWYVSFWNHLGSGSDGPPLREALTLGDKTFDAFLYTLTHPTKWTAIPYPLHAGWVWPKPVHEGFYSSLVEHCYGKDVDVFLDTKQLNTGLARLLGLEPIHLKPQNTGTLRPKALVDPWTESLEQEVLAVDGEKALQFGYTDRKAVVPAIIR